MKLLAGVILGTALAYTVQRTWRRILLTALSRGD